MPPHRRRKEAASRTQKPEEVRDEPERVVPNGRRRNARLREIRPRTKAEAAFDRRSGDPRACRVRERVVVLVETADVAVDAGEGRFLDLSAPKR